MDVNSLLSQSFSEKTYQKQPPFLARVTNIPRARIKSAILSRSKRIAVKR